MTYEEFIQDILTARGRFACGDEYYERHHIIPKCLGGTNDENNLIDLYAKEHYEAHRLLALENRDNKKLTYAWWLMSYMKNKDEDRYILTAEEYEECRRAYSSFRHTITGVLHPSYGKTISEEHKRKLSKIHKGKKLSDEVRKNMSIAHKGQGAGGENPMARPVVCDGIIFGSASECAKKYDIQPYTMRMWLRGKNKMPQKFYDMGLRYVDDETEHKVQTGLLRGKEHPNSRRVKCDDIIYETLKSCAKACGIPACTMNAWLKGRNPMPKKYVDRGLAYVIGGEEEE